MRYLLILLMLASPAAAHKIIAAGYAAGADIEGEVGFSNGAPAVGVTLFITGPDGEALGEVITDEDGFFIFTPTHPVTHYFFGELGSGHIAKFEVALEGVPDQTNAATATSDVVVSAELAEMVAVAVRDEIRPLRRELIASREKATFQSIVGGIGFIFGMFGVGFYMAARKREAQDD